MMNETLHLLFAVAGGFLGWWLRQRLTSSPLPPDVMEMLKKILERRKEQETESMLRDLLDRVSRKNEGSNGQA
jgi:hypothetical protein